MSKRTCAIDECERQVVARGWCDTHYRRWLHHGDAALVPPRSQPQLQRFWAKVEKTATCWLWRGATGDGYGHAFWNGAVVRAHRVSYELARGAIPAGLEIDHLCRERRCVNPDHLEAVEPRINKLRGESIVTQWAKRDACGRGHPFTPENTLMRSDGGRRCRVCQREFEARRPSRRR